MREAGKGEGTADADDDGKMYTTPGNWGAIKEFLNCFFDSFLKFFN